MMKQWSLIGLFALNMLLNVTASIGFKMSAGSVGWQRFLLWQVIGNLTGFGGVLVLTAIYRSVPLHIAYPISQGLAVLAVQVFAARFLFRESIAPLQWLGTLCVVAGIALVSMQHT